MLDPTLIDALSKLGSLGFAIIAVWGFATGRIRVGSLVDRREGQLMAEASEWRTIAQDALAKLARLTDVLEATVGKKLD
jgi:hypothetical protein